MTTVAVASEATTCWVFMITEHENHRWESLFTVDNCVCFCVKNSASNDHTIAYIICNLIFQVYTVVYCVAGVFLYQLKPCYSSI